MVSEFIKSIKVKQNTDANCYIKYELEDLEIPENIRIKFSKKGSLQYISHLDLQRLWNRIIIRSGLPIWYTQGFNPHPKMVFALPLPVGVESVCEYLDIKINKKISPEDIKELLSEESPAELEILDVYAPVDKFSDIAKAKYRISFITPLASEELARKFNEFFKTSPIIMKKHTKSGEKDFDISKLVFDYSAEYKDGKIEISATLSAGTESLNPEFLMSSLRQYNVLPEIQPDKEEYSIMREEVLKENGDIFR